MSMNCYLALWQGKRMEIRGEGLALYTAREKAADTWKVPPKKRHLIAIALCEKDNEPLGRI